MKSLWISWAGRTALVCRGPKRREYVPGDASWHRCCVYLLAQQNKLIPVPGEITGVVFPPHGADLGYSIDA